MVKGVCRGFTESPALDRRNAAYFLSGGPDSGAWQTRRHRLADYAGCRLLCIAGAG